MSNWLTKIVSTTLVVVTGCLIAVALTLFYMIATVLGRELDPVTFGSMLAFAAACMGVGYKQFKAKRETAWAEDEETGIAYKPLSPRDMAEVKKNRYDVGAFPTRTPIRDIGTVRPAPVAVVEAPESVDERENAGRVVAPRPLPPAPEPDENEWEGEEGA